MAVEYVKAKDIAQIWQISTRRINQLCVQGKIKGAYKLGKFWMIPADAKKPESGRSSVKQSELLNPDKKLRPCFVGSASFPEVVRDYYYVDKTLFIKELLDDSCKVILFARPRRFGKSLTMSMLHTFFEKTDDDTSVYFQDKKIWSCGEYYRQQQGKYPVLFISFKGTYHSNWKDMYHNLCEIISEEVFRHKELLDHDAVDPYDRLYLERIMKSEGDIVDYQYALKKAMRILAKYHGEQVVLIIDEYDTPIQQGYKYGFYDQVTEFMRNVFSSALKDNPDLKIGVLTGILRVAKESLFSGLNNLIVDTILDTKYQTYFGFTESEVKEMAVYYQREDKLPEIQEWYDGYRFGSVDIYNPWSVISYFHNDCVPKAFWARTSENSIVKELIKKVPRELGDGLSALLEGKAYYSMIDTDIIYPEITTDPNTIFSFLLLTGYLKLIEVDDMFDDIPYCSLSIPNKEIKSIFKKEIISNYENLLSLSVLRDFKLALRNGDVLLFAKTLEDYLMKSASYFDTSDESFYHGMIFGMVAVMSDYYQIYSNRESGDGRFDISLKPLSKSLEGYILEFKVAKASSDEKLSDLAEKALGQIHDKKYYTDMIYSGVKQISLYGVAFRGKHVAITREKFLA